MIQWFKNLISIKSKVNIQNESNQNPFIWCLVGNITEIHLHGEIKEIKKGTKQFSPGTKVYCFPALWGDGYENIKVIGRPRKTSRYITVIIRSDCITNWRLKAVYSPHIIKIMKKNGGWTSNEEDKNRILEMLKYFK